MTLLERLETAQDHTEQARILAESLTQIDKYAQASLERPIDFEALLIKLGALPKMSQHVRRWEKAVRARAKELQENRNPSAPNSLDELTKGLEGAEGLEAPPGYTVDRSGVYQDGKLISYTPAVVLAQLQDYQSGKVMTEIAWLDAGRWHTALLPRSIVTDSRKILALADDGADVSSCNASDMVTYLRLFTRHNEVPRIMVSGRLGWVGGSFLRGRQCHGAQVRLESQNGVAQIADSITCKGTIEEWRTFMEDQIGHRPSMLLAVYASMCAPLLELLKADGFVIDWSGPSGRGKSTALDVACAVWGDPDGFRRTWDTASSVGPQEMAAFLCHLPVVLDDTNFAQGRRAGETIAQTIYAIPGGRERARGHRASGMRVSRDWRTVLLSTGEQKITSYAKAAGAKRRCLCLTGPPMGRVMEDVAPVRLVKTTARSVHGVAGRAFVDALMLADRKSLRERYRALCGAYDAKGHGSTDRSLGAAVAVMELASELARPFMGVTEGDRLAALALAWDAAVKAGEDSDEPREALQDLWAWVCNQDARMRGAGGSVPSTGFVGSWEVDSVGAWEEFSVVEQEVRKVLEGWGRAPTYCIDEWLRRTSDQTGNPWARRGQTRKLRKGQRIRALIFRREDVGEMLG